MAEQDSKPQNEEPENPPELAQPTQRAISRRLLPLALGLIALLAGCSWWGSQPTDIDPQAELSTPTITQTARSAQSSAALTRIASSLAQPQQPTSTPTPAAVAISSNTEVPLPTVTPTLVPKPAVTRTIEMQGDATLRLQLNNETFESSGQPVTIPIEPRTYTLGGDTMTQNDEWCMQVGPTGLIFDLVFTLQPISENLQVGGTLRLYDGFCGEWGSLGNELSSVPMNVTIPTGFTAKLAPTLQAQGSLLGIPNVLNISTGVYLDLTIRNPMPR